MPRRIADDDDEIPRRRRRAAKAVAIEVAEESERGLMMRALLRSPKDMVAGALAVAAVGAIVTNALFLQSGPHPSPMFGTVVTLPAPAPTPVSPSANVLPRPRPPEATKIDVTPEPRVIEPRTIEPKVPDNRASEVKPSEKAAPDPMANLVKATSGTPSSTSSIPRPPAPIPVSSREEGLSPGGSRRVAAVQRALTEYGYGQLKTTGIFGPETHAAVLKFEKARKIPANGQITERMVHELSAMIGHSVD